MEHQRDGATMAEYVILLTLIGLMLLFSVQFVMPKLFNKSQDTVVKNIESETGTLSNKNFEEELKEEGGVFE